MQGNPTEKTPLNKTDNVAHYFQTLNIPFLVESVLQDVVEAKPQEPFRVVELLTQSLEQHKSTYYRSVQDKFFRQLEQMQSSAKGKGQPVRALSSGTKSEPKVELSSSSSSSVSNYTSYNVSNYAALMAPEETIELYFGVPLLDGSVFELFPTSRSLRVTDLNFPHFSKLVDLFLKFYGKGSHSHFFHPKYIAAAIPHLPLQAALYVQDNTNKYDDVLLLMERYLLADSTPTPWRLRDAGQWKALAILDAVPFRGQLFPVEYTTSAGVRRRGSGGHPNGSFHPVEMEDAARYVAAARQTLSHLSSVPPMLEVEPISTDSSEETMTAEEKEFWSELENFLEDPTLLPHKMSFVLNLPYKKVCLVKNGQYLTVNESNVRYFVEMAKEKRKEIHDAFTKPPVLDSSYTLYSDKSSPVHPSKADKLNAFRLEEGDRVSFRPGMDVLNFYEANKPTKEEASNEAKMEAFRRTLKQYLQTKELAFCLHCSRGDYDLIPSGRLINVTHRNIEEYLYRLQYAYNVFTREVGEPAGEHEIESGNNIRRDTGDSALLNVGPSPQLTAAVDHIADITINKEIDIPRQNSSGTVGDTSLGEEDLTFLREFQEHLDVLNDSRKTTGHTMNDIINQLSLRWNIVIPSKQCFIALKPPSSVAADDACVTGENFDVYYRQAKRKIKEVVGTIRSSGRYPPPETDTKDRRKNSESVNALNNT
ncbi:hypothetical protein AGDE_12727 [Angomonas deanei]|nr:hypothetical protein AGDE_12727 [Angomonas deanei]|eukprot:EPY23792.1 hypothetical protein AGDE_12727 [Angomonas deanei]